jgi:hypothetical protein
MTEYKATELSRVPSYDNPKTLDVTIEFTGDNGDVFYKTMRFSSEDQIKTDWEDRTQRAIKNRIEELARVPDRNFTESEVKELLIRKGYLKAEESLDDLKSASELAAEEVKNG